MPEMNEEVISRNFIENEIDKDLQEGVYDKLFTRFPPEPNGYLHIGHAKSILLNQGLAKEYGGTFNLRFDDTNPQKEKEEFVDSISKDVEWICGEKPPVYFASNYFDDMYECALKLIRKGKAYVCDLSAEEIREYRGTLKEPGKDSPYRNRSVEENLSLIEDAIEGVTHSICTLEFEDHRPLYDWVVKECEFEVPPRQIEFAKMYLTNVVTGKRYIKKLVEDGIVDGWDDPRLVTITALRRRGYTASSIRKFMELCGVSKSNSSVDSAMLEYCIREDLKMSQPRMMAVLDPVKLVIDNYEEGKIEYLDVPNNQENPELGTRKVPFGRELYIEREDFKIDPPRKYFRLFPGNEVRLMSAYFVTCTGYETDEDGNVTVVHATYDPETKSGSGFTGRKVKGKIHWVAADTAAKAEVRLYENIVDEEKGVYNEDGSINVNPNSLTILKECYMEPALKEAKPGDKFQFMRTGFFCVDTKDTTAEHMVFNRIVSLKSSYRPNK